MTKIGKHLSSFELFQLFGDPTESFGFGFGFAMTKIGKFKLEIFQLFWGPPVRLEFCQRLFAVQF